MSQLAQKDVRMDSVRNRVNVNATKVTQNMHHPMFALPFVGNLVKTVGVPGPISVLAIRIMSSLATVQRSVNPYVHWGVRTGFVFNPIHVNVSKGIIRFFHTIVCHIVKFDVSMEFAIPQINVNAFQASKEIPLMLTNVTLFVMIVKMGSASTLENADAFQASINLPCSRNVLQSVQSV